MMLFLAALLATNAFAQEMDAQVVELTLLKHRERFRDCYEKQVKLNPDLQGRMVVAFTLTQGGKAEGVTLKSTTLHNPKVENCVLQAIREIPDFPPPSSGAAVQVSYPFKFTPRLRKN